MRRLVVFIIFLLIIFSIFETGCITALDHAIIAKNSIEKEKYDAGIENAKKAIAMDRTYGPGWYWLGVAYYYKGNYDEAIPAFQKVIELKSSADQIQSSYRLLGWSYYNKGNYDKAIMDFNEALKHIAPDYRNDLKSALFGWSLAYYRKRNYDAAINGFNKVLELEPKNAYVLSWRGWSYLRRGNFDEALNDFNSAIKNSDPNKKNLLREAIRGKAFSYLVIYMNSIIKVGE